MYPIYYDGLECGTAIIEEIGLYSRIICKCDLPTNAPCKIIMKVDEASINLGTCIKEGAVYQIDTKVPSKNIRNKTLEFSIFSPSRYTDLEYLPIYEDMPFPHLNKLEKARMRFINGQVGICIIE